MHTLHHYDITSTLAYLAFQLIPLSASHHFPLVL